MAIPGNRLKVAGATAESKSRTDFIKTNESSRFSTVLEVPQAFVSSAIDNVSDLGTAVAKDASKVYDSIGELKFNNNITSLARTEISVNTADVMKKATSVVGQSIGNKKMIDLLFSDCPYDGANLNYLFGLLLGLLPSLANRQHCSQGLLSMLIETFSGDTTPDMIGKSLMGIVDNVKLGKGTKFLEDLNVNADVLKMGSTLLNVNSSISGIVQKSDLFTSRKPNEAYATMTANMDFNNTIFDINQSVTQVAKRKNLSKLPIIPSENDEPVKVSFSDILSIKIHGQNNKSIFDNQLDKQS